jgi:hypothetical protein
MIAPDSDRVAHRDPVLGVLDRHPQQPLGRADRARRDHEPAVADPPHGQVEALPGLAQDVLLGDADVLEHQRGGTPLAHGRDRL